MSEFAEYAEHCNYWKTSRTSPDGWLAKTIGLIESFGGELLASGFGNEHSTGRSAYMVRFRVMDDVFRIAWPVMPSQSGDTLSAQRQAATMMYHDVKAKCVAAQVLGSRVAFFAWLEIEGKPASQLASERLQEELPKMLTHQP